MSTREDRHNALVKQAEEVTTAIPESLDFRSRVLGKAVALEYLTSLLLAERLDIDMSNSVLFGGSYRALNFSERINLLREMTTIKGEDRRPLTILSEVRNKVAHDAKVLKITDALSESNVQWILSNYSDTKESREIEHIEAAFDKMADSVIQSAKDALGVGTRHSDTRIAQRIVEEKFNALADGLRSAEARVVRDVVTKNLSGFMWTHRAIAQLPTLTMRNAIADAREIFKKKRI